MECVEQPSDFSVDHQNQIEPQVQSNQGEFANTDDLQEENSQTNQQSTLHFNNINLGQEVEDNAMSYTMSVDDNASVKESSEELDRIFCTDETGGYSLDELYNYSADCFDIFSSIRNTLSKQPNIARENFCLPPKDPSAPSHTLVLDLDDTLIHNISLLDNIEYKDYDICFDTTYDNEMSTVYILFRPYLFHFLEEMSKLYEIIIFTAGDKSCYSKIVDYFNAEKTLISHALYRDSCIFNPVNSENDHFKVLECLNREMSKTLIIDNTPLVYSYNVNNAIPIPSWTGDKEDKELYILLGFLRKLAKVDDIRPELEQKYHLSELLNNETI